MNIENGDKATVREVYRLLEEMRKEIAGSINRLEIKFDTLEAGRLSNLETRFATLKGNIEGRATVNATIVSVAIGIIFIIVRFFLDKE